MAETVSDILGKGLKFENRVIVEMLPPRSVFGTVPAFVGAAHWGPVNQPMLINKDLEKYIGSPVVGEDENDARMLDYSGLSAEYHLRNSRYCYFTRVSDGTDKRASILLQRNAKGARLRGNNSIQNTTTVIKPDINDKFKIKYKDETAVTVTIPHSPQAIYGIDISSVNTSELVGNKILFTIDGFFTEYSITGGENLVDALKTTLSSKHASITSSDAENYIYQINKNKAVEALDVDEDFYFIDSSSTGNEKLYFFENEIENEITDFTYASTEPESPTEGDYWYDTETNKLKVIEESEGDFVEIDNDIVFVDKNYIVFNSQLYGGISSLTIHSFPGTEYNNNVKNVTGTNSSINAIVEYINEEVNKELDGENSLLIGFDQFRQFMILTNELGVDEKFTLQSIDNNVYTSLYVDSDDIDDEKVGVDEKTGGKITAVYTGQEGNNISFVVREESFGSVMQIFWKSSVIGTFYDFSYNVDDPFFIGTMINNDPQASNYITLDPESEIETIPSFDENKVYRLSGGSSGIDNLEDYVYLSALNEYKNLDLYDVDLVVCSGVLGEEVVDAMDGVCKYRQDAFGVIDTPQSTSPFYVERWHNGMIDRGSKLDSEYLVLYYPWVMINTPSSKLKKQWAPPSVRTVGAITTCDLDKQNKYSIPAGHNNAPIRNIEGIEVYLTEEQKQRIYADRLGNNINPIVYNKNLGYFIDGQKTTKRGQTPINRLKTVRAALWLKRAVARLAPNYYWRPIDARTRSALEFDLTELLEQLAQDRVIKGNYVVDVSEELNDEYIEAQGGLVARMEWYPIKAVEKIKIINVIRDKQVDFSVEF